MKRKSLPRFDAGGIFDWLSDAGSNLGSALGATGDTASTVGDALIGAGIGGLTGGSWKGALAGGALGAGLGGGGAQIGSLLSSNPETAKLLGNAILGAVAGGSTKVGAGAGAGLGALATMVAPSVQGMLNGTGGGSSASDVAGGMSHDPSKPGIAEMLAGITGGGSSDPASSVAQAASSSTAGLSPLIKKYWPQILAAIGAYENKKTTKAPVAPALPSYMTTHLAQLQNPRTTAAPYQGDYYTYGQQPEHSFFSQNQLPSYTPGQARGGLQKTGASSPLNEVVSRHVKGPGDGRQDQINARLSNDEYVMDAESVAMLGNGSADAGAKKLDRMRENIRKHKGKKLAKGKISPDAHSNAEDYI